MLYKSGMKKEMKPRRMGVTRKLNKLPSVKEQTKALEEAGCDPVFTWAEYPKVEAAILDDDTMVAVDMAVFAGHRSQRFSCVALDKGPPKKTGPKATLATASPDAVAAIMYNWDHTQPKEQHAMGVAAAMGIEVNDDQVRYWAKKLKKQRMLDEAAAIGNEGKE